MTFSCSNLVVMLLETTMEIVYKIKQSCWWNGLFLFRFKLKVTHRLFKMFNNSGLSTALTFMLNL